MSESPFERAIPFPGIRVGAAASEPALPDPRQLKASDEELIGQVAKRDVAALRILFGRHGRLVQRIALRILHDQGEAEEVVQDVFFYVFRKAVVRNYSIRFVDRPTARA